VIIDTGEAVTVAKPNIAGLSEREPSTKCILQTVSGETLPILKEVFVTLILGRHPLKTWVFVANIADEFISELDVLRPRHASSELKRFMLRLGKEEKPLRRPGE
jgi:hypothetical protein